MENEMYEGEVKVKNVRAAQEDARTSTRHLLQSLFKAGASLVALPVSMLPHDSQTHMRAAGREFTRGVASLTREVTDALEKATEESHHHKAD
jgi:hypothetical protein